MNKQQGFIDHIVKFTEEEIQEFLEKNKDEKFYAFAYDVNAETYGIYLSFNTISDFNNKLKLYQNSEYAQLYYDSEQIDRLKYNPGDWKYQNFVSIEFIYPAKIKELYDVVLDAHSNDLLNYAEKALSKFKLTNTYQSIPKDKDFIAFTIDHHEDELDAIKRVISIN